VLKEFDEVFDIDTTGILEDPAFKPMMDATIQLHLSTAAENARRAYEPTETSSLRIVNETRVALAKLHIPFDEPTLQQKATMLQQKVSAISRECLAQKVVERLTAYALENGTDTVDKKTYYDTVRSLAPTKEDYIEQDIQSANAVAEVVYTMLEAENLDSTMADTLQKTKKAQKQIIQHADVLLGMFVERIYT
jgi:hypothetical protein